MFGCRWVRPLPKASGVWKSQLASKHLKQASRGNQSYVQDLLAEDKTILNRRGPHGRTLLFEAVRRNRSDLVHWLLERGANPNLTGAVNSESFVQLSPLAACYFYKHEHLVDTLLEHGSVDDIFRLTYRGEIEQVKQLLCTQPNLLNAEDQHDAIYFSPLAAFAIVGDQLSLLKDFVDAGFHVPIYSFQLLYIATHFGNKQIVDYLLEQGAIVSCADSSLWMSTNDLDLLKLLVENGLSPNQRPYTDLTPLLYASRADKGTRLEKIRYLLELGADVNAQTKDLRTPLHYAANSGNRLACELLVEAGADIQAKTDIGETAADFAARKGHHELADWLQGN